MVEDNFFYKEIGRLIFCFKRNENKVEIIKIYFKPETEIKDIKSFPYEKEIDQARKEACKYFGVRYKKLKY